MADHFGRAAARNYAAGKAAGLSSREIAQIPAGEFPVQIRPLEEDDCFHNPDGPRAGYDQGENPVD